jgi:hypothetical protein
MKSLRCMIAVAALAFTVPAQAGINDPEVIIYRVSSVLDDGMSNGTATSFHCTNFSGVNEIVRIVVRDQVSTIKANQPFNVPHLNTFTASTKDTVVYNDFSFATGAIQQGTAAIAATSVNVTCTAMQVLPQGVLPQGIALHMTRFNPIAGTQE